MAYYYDFDGVSYFDAGSPHNALELSNYRLIIKAAFNGTASGFYVIQGNNGNDRVRIRLDSFDFLEIRYITNSSRVRWQLNPSEYADNQPHEFEIVRSSDNHELFLDGVSQGIAASSATASDTANFIGRANATTTEPYSLYAYKAYDSSVGGNLIFDYGDKNASGTEMLNTAGTNAVLQGNQNWVFYDDGGGSTVTADVGFTVSAPTASVSASATLPAPSSYITFTVNTPTASVNASATLPQPTANASFSLPVPIIAASATATEPNFNASVNFTIPAPTFSAEATATLPQPLADGNFTIKAPTFSVVAIVGGIAIIVDEETNINQRVMSNNINAPILSNNING